MQATRREFLRTSAALSAVLATGVKTLPALAADVPQADIKLGAVTYLWGKDWDLPTLLANLEAADIEGVELRTTHKHGVEPSLSAAERADVKKRFADSPVEFVGPGSNEQFCHKDPARLKQAIEATRGFLKLSADCGGSGVKVKPNNIYKDVPVEKTTAQIAASLNQLGKYAADLGQEIRLEVHGSCSPLPIMKQIMDQVESPAVGACWNCNSQDLDGEGVEHNFNLIKDHFAHTAHVREVNVGDYPYQQVFGMFVAMGYQGWILLECRTNPGDLVAAYKEQRELFDAMIAKSKAKLG